jgi:hypothetical protein
MNLCKALFAALLLGWTAPGLVAAAPEGDAAKTIAALSRDRVEAARKTYQTMYKNYTEGRHVAEDTLYRWSLRWLEAEKQLAEKPADRLAAFKGHYDRMRELDRLIGKLQRAGQTTVDQVSSVEYYRVEAELWLVQAKGERKE